MRDLKLQVETNWVADQVHPEVGHWDVTVYAVVVPHARYRVASWETGESDPMFSVVEKLSWIFNPVFDTEGDSNE